MKLLHLEHEGVKKLIDNMEEECTNIKKNALSMSWYMRGGVTYEDILNMSSEEREEINMICCFFLFYFFRLFAFQV